MTSVAAVAVCLLLLGLAVFQVLLALGAPLGRFAWGGRHRTLPPPLRVASLASVGLYALLGAVVLARAGVVGPDVPAGAVRVAAWVVAGYFLLGVAMNLASRSASERAVMVPLCAALGLLTTVVAVG